MSTTTQAHVISSSSLFIAISAEKNNKGADFTIRSKATGKDYTYKISRSFFGGKWYTHIKVETGYMQFVRLGCYFNGGIFLKGAKVTTPSAVAIAHVLARVEAKEFEGLDSKLEVMHLGGCIRCGRTLTDADSIARGLGPICIGL